MVIVIGTMKQVMDARNCIEVPAIHVAIIIV